MPKRSKDSLEAQDFRPVELHEGEAGDLRPIGRPSGGALVSQLMASSGGNSVSR